MICLYYSAFFCCHAKQDCVIITLGTKNNWLFYVKTKKTEFVLCMQQCKAIYNFLSFLAQFCFFGSLYQDCACTVCSQERLKLLQYLAFIFSIKNWKTCWINNNGDLELLIWLSKEVRLLNARTLECVLLRFWPGVPCWFLSTFT